MTPSAQVKAYLAKLPPGSRRAAKIIRDAIREAAPDATEAFSYQMPGFRLHDRALIWYAAWKEHTSLYPINAEIQRKHAAALKRYKTAKGTIQFPLDDPPPAALIKRLVRARISQMEKALAK